MKILGGISGTNERRHGSNSSPNCLCYGNQVKVDELNDARSTLMRDAIGYRFSVENVKGKCHM